MQAPTPDFEGSLTTDGTAQTLATITVPGSISLHFDYTPNAGGDTVEVYIEETFQGVTRKCAYLSIAGVAAEPKVRVLTVDLPYGGVCKAQKTAGTNHAGYTWMAVRLS